MTALARVAAGRLDRAERLLDDDAAARREELLALARGVYADPSFEPSVAAAAVVRMADTAAKTARAAAEEEVEWLDLPDREEEQRLRRAEFGATRESVLEALEELAAWYPRPRRGGGGSGGRRHPLRPPRGPPRGRQRRATPRRRTGRRDRARVVALVRGLETSSRLALEALFVRCHGSAGSRLIGRATLRARRRSSPAGRALHS